MNRMPKTAGKKAQSQKYIDALANRRNAYLPDDVTYNIGDKILYLCDDGQTYEAKIISVEANGYKIHYQGWSKRYDELITKEDALERFKACTEEETATEPKAELKEACQEEKSRFNASKRKSNAISSVPEKRAELLPAIKNLDSNLQEAYAKRSDSDLQDAFENLLTKGLSRVLLEENNKITNDEAFPKVTGNRYSIERIIKEYLESKRYKVDTFEASIKDTKKFQPSKLDLYKRMIFLVRLFNKRFVQMLVYDEENEKGIYDLGKINGNKDFSLQFNRYSACLCFTQLLRFIHRLPKILMPELVANELVSEASNFVGAIQDLCKYLNKNINRYYNANTYYKLLDF